MSEGRNEAARVTEVRDDAARVAGRGVLWIAAAKGWFMLAGWAIEFALPHLFSTTLFGAWKVVVAAMSVVNNTVVTATIQTAAKFASERDADRGVTRAALRIIAPLGLALALAWVAAAPAIARFLRDPSLVPYLRGTAAIVFCYALYAVFVGVANGLRRFHVQASLDMSYSTLKATLVIGAAGVGLGLIGAVGGFVAAAALVLAAAAVVVGAQPAVEPLPARRLLGFLSRMVLYTLLLNLLLLLDLFLVKRFAPTGPTTAYYAAAQTLARIPYQGILAVAFVVFPLVSRATFAEDREATRGYVRATMRFSLIFCAAVAAVFEANPTAVLRVPYPAEYARGAAALELLAPAQVFFSLFAVACTILNGAGRTRDALALVGGAVVLLVVCCVGAQAAHGAGVGRQTAAGVLAACGTCGLASLVVLARRFGATLPLPTAARVAAAFGAAALVGRAVPDGSRLRTLGECALVFATFVGLLVALGELSRDDRASLRRIFAPAGGRGYGLPR